MACRFKKYRIQTRLSKLKDTYYEWSLARGRWPQWVTVHIPTGERSKPREAGTLNDVRDGIKRGTYEWYVP